MDRGVESVSCDFLLPTLCEMDEHPSLQVDLLKSEFIIAIVAAFLGILLILVVCCFWCCKVIILFKNISIYIYIYNEIFNSIQTSQNLFSWCNRQVIERKNDLKEEILSECLKAHLDLGH